MIQLSLLPTDEAVVQDVAFCECDAVAGAPAVPEGMVYRSYAIPLGIDEQSGCERFARGFHRLERWRSIEESCGNHGLPPNTSIMLPESGRISGYVSFRKRMTEDDLPEVNGSWKRTVVENTNDGSMVVYAKCCGPACCESRTPAMKRLSVNDWARRLTMCVACHNYAELAKRINEARKEQIAREEAEAAANRPLHKSTKYERERRAELKQLGLCIQCKTPKPSDAFARCQRCRRQNMDNWRRYKLQCRRQFRGLKLVEEG